MNWLRILYIIIILSICTCSHNQPFNDFAGRSYPSQCRENLDWVDVKIQMVSRQELTALAEKYSVKLKMNTQLYGLYIPFGDNGNPLIVIYKDLRGWVLADVIRHERCHHIAGSWHQ